MWLMVTIFHQVSHLPVGLFWDHSHYQSLCVITVVVECLLICSYEQNAIFVILFLLCNLKKYYFIHCFLSTFLNIVFII